MLNNLYKSRWLLYLSILLLPACASHIPKNIQEPVASKITVSEVQQKPAQFKGEKVRWGGTIVKVINLENKTLIEVLSRNLTSKGEPKSSSQGQGRFMASIDGFIDPAEYPEKRKITITGHIAGIKEQPVGEYLYHYPVVTTEAFYLWPEPIDNPYSLSRPYYYDPFFDPWYPYPYSWGRHPYYW